MGFSGNGASSLKYNHGMLSQRGARFQKTRKYITVDTDKIPVDHGRMDRIAKDAKRSAVINLVLVILVIGLIALVFSIL